MSSIVFTYVSMYIHAHTLWLLVIEDVSEAAIKIRIIVVYLPNKMCLEVYTIQKLCFHSS